MLQNKTTQKAIDSYNKHYKLLNSDGEIIINDVKELDRIKTKDGRIGTIMATWFDTTGLEVEFDDNAPETETIDIKDVREIIDYFELTKEQIEILNKYKIDYNVQTKKELLINIDFVMTSYLDSNDEPTEDFKILEKLYNEVYDK